MDSLKQIRGGIMDRLPVKMPQSSSTTDTYVVKTSRPVSTLSKPKVRDKPLRARVDMSSSPSTQNLKASVNSRVDHGAKLPSTRPQLRTVSSQSSLRRPTVVNSSSRVNVSLPQAMPPSSTSISQPRHQNKPVAANAIHSRRSVTIDVVPSHQSTQESKHLHSSGVPKLLPSARISHTAKINDSPISTPDKLAIDSESDRLHRNSVLRSPKGYPVNHLTAPIQERRPFSPLSIIRATPKQTNQEAHVQNQRSPKSPTSDTRRSVQTSPSRSPRGKELASDRHRPSAMARSPFAPMRAHTDPSMPSSPANVSNPLAPASSTPTSARNAMMSTPTLVLPSSVTEMSMDTSDIWDAKHERKLLDLEISNKSLMAINAALESSKVKLTREIRELRQQYLAKTIEPSISGDDSETEQMHLAFAEMMKPSSNSASTSLGAELAEAMAQQDRELEQIHSRCRAAIDQLMDEARSAILRQPGPDIFPAAKVLHPSEFSTTDDALNGSYKSNGAWSESSMV